MAVLPSLWYSPRASAVTDAGLAPLTVTRPVGAVARSFGVPPARPGGARGRRSCPSGSGVRGLSRPVRGRPAGSRMVLAVYCKVEGLPVGLVPAAAPVAA